MVESNVRFLGGMGPSVHGQWARHERLWGRSGPTHGPIDPGGGTGGKAGTAREGRRMLARIRRLGSLARDTGRLRLRSFARP
jgi:hypothetical protein